jgi:FdhD protein
MVMKAATVGIGFLAAISAPTALAIALAKETNLTLVGFARADGYGIYTYPQRLVSEASAHAQGTEHGNPTTAAPLH